MAILVTGCGYIGAALLRRLASSPHELLAFDNFYSTSRAAIEAALPARAELLVGDVADSADVARAFDRLDSASVVFHLAAQPSASMAAREPDVTERSNLVGARLVLQAARECGAGVVFGGSFRVHGDDLAGQCVDERTPYGRVGDLSHLSKIYVEQLARMLGLPFASVRLGVTYGLSPVMKTTPSFMTVPNLFCQRAAHGQSLNVLEDRPMAFIHVEDAVTALLAAADCLSAGFSVFSAVTEVATIGQVALTVQELLQARGQTTCIEGSTGSTERFEVRSALAFDPRQTLHSSLGEVLDYFLEHPHSA